MSMKLIYTNDGKIGLDLAGKERVIWCDSVQEAATIAEAHYASRIGDCAPTWISLAKDIAYAVDHMAKTGDDCAHFGIFGSFMWSFKSEEAAS